MYIHNTHNRHLCHTLHCLLNMKRHNNENALINDWGDEGTSMMIMASGSAPGTHMRSYLLNR